MQLKPVPEQVVVVMGASSGIGRATALRFAEEGAKVVVAARGEAGLKSLVTEIEVAGGTATAVVADVADPAQCQAVADRAVAEYGRLDTWVHMAGVLLVAGFDDTTPEEFARVIQVNLLGQVHGAKAALPHLRRGGGAFISMSSMGSQRGIPCRPPTARPSTASTASSRRCASSCSATAPRSASRRSCPARSTPRCSTTPAPRWASSRSPRRPPTRPGPSPTRSCTRPHTRSATWSSADRPRR